MKTPYLGYLSLDGNKLGIVPPHLIKVKNLPKQIPVDKEEVLERISFMIGPGPLILSGSVIEKHVDHPTGSLTNDDLAK